MHIMILGLRVSVIHKEQYTCIVQSQVQTIINHQRRIKVKGWKIIWIHILQFYLDSYFIILSFQYFYSIKDISIGGRCVCNGHANTCDRSDSNNPNLLVCSCKHNTCGSQCETCCPGFVQKKWKQARADKIFMCERKLRLNLHCCQPSYSFLITC